MTKFFKESISRGIGKNTKNTVTPVGSCADFGNPSTTNSGVLKGDCSTWEGCLGCENYAVHADDVDVRKLLSAKLVVLSTKHLSDSKEQFELNFRFFLDRVDAIVDSIKKKSKSHSKMVVRTMSSVDEGELDSFWMAKYDLLVNLGVIRE